MSTIRTACSERSAGGERGGDGEETLERIVWMIVILERPRKRFKSDESGKRQIGVSGVEGERVWKRAGGSAAAGCWGHFLFFSFLVLFFLGMDFWEGLGGVGWVLKFFVSVTFIFIWMGFVDAVKIDVCCCLYYFFLFDFKIRAM